MVNLTNEDKEKIEYFWSSIQENESKLIKIRNEVRELSNLLLSDYKDLTEIINKPYTNGSFIELTDLTSNTLYFCLDPFAPISAVFFIDKEDAKEPIPILIYLESDENNNPTVSLQVAPYYSMSHLSSKGKRPQDMLIKFPDLVSPLKTPEAKMLERTFNNPPSAGNSERFENILKERLFELTEEDKYLKPAIN
jgi:hypothetical protein